MQIESEEQVWVEWEYRNINGMDPNTFDAKKMQEMTVLRVNRVSLGAQAFQEKLLRACGKASMRQQWQLRDEEKERGVREKEKGMKVQNFF